MSLFFTEDEGVKKFLIVDTSVVMMDIDYSIDRVKDPTKFGELFPKHSEVLYNSSSEDVSCSCRRFERFGLLCRHIFYALRVLKITCSTRKYVCHRWTKNVVPPKIYSSPRTKLCKVNADMVLGDLIQRVYYNVETALDKVIGNKEKLTKFVKAQEDLLHKERLH